MKGHREMVDHPGSLINTGWKNKILIIKYILIQFNLKNVTVPTGQFRHDEQLITTQISIINTDINSN